MTTTASRTTNTLRNTILGFSGLIISQLITFATKGVFVRLLGAEYNGVNGLFTNILSILNLAELGFATSVSFALYKPLKEGDELKQAALMNFFAKTYRIIAIVVAAAGCCCIPFLQYLIAEDISTLPFSLNQLRIYFAMFLEEFGKENIYAGNFHHQYKAGHSVEIIATMQKFKLNTER